MACDLLPVAMFYTNDSVFIAKKIKKYWKVIEHQHIDIFLIINKIIDIDMRHLEIVSDFKEE